MKPEEKQLTLYLNYTRKDTDVFLRADAILWFQEKFLDYWLNIDQKYNSNNICVINELYRNNESTSLNSIALSVGLHVRTLNRYREKYIAKMQELIKEYQDILNNTDS